MVCPQIGTAVLKGLIVVRDMSGELGGEEFQAKKDSKHENQQLPCTYMIIRAHRGRRSKSYRMQWNSKSDVTVEPQALAGTRGY